MEKDEAISIAVEALYEAYVSNGGSFGELEARNAINALQELREYYPMGELVLKQNDDSFWIEENSNG